MKKDTVDEIRHIDTRTLRESGIFKKWPGYSFTTTWRRSEEIIASIGMQLEGCNEMITGLKFTYSVTNWHGEKPSQNYRIQLDSTACHFGGVRWWFRCPLSINNRVCNRRCRILYLPSNSDYFGCRECHDLTYESRQQHRNRYYEGFFKPLSIVEELESKLERSTNPTTRIKLMERLSRVYFAMRKFAESIELKKGI